jgi:hypothetical protein
MATLSELFPSKYMKAADLGGKPWTLKIQAAPTETLKDMSGGVSPKCVVYFVGAKKALPLNRTNFHAIADIAGDDSDTWPGHEVELYPTRVLMGEKIVDAIRIRAPAVPGMKLAPSPAPKPATPALAADDDDMDDEIPF